MAATRVVVTQLVGPADSNGRDVCTGGALLAWVDVAAGLAAKSLARGPCVTASVDAVHFLHACRVGSVVVVAAMVNRTFNSSMEVGVRVEEEDPATGERRHCCSAYLTFVAVQPGGGEQARALPRVVPTSARAAGIHADAAQRRAARLAARDRLRGDPAAAGRAAAARLHPVTHHAGPPTLPPGMRMAAGREGGPTKVAPGLTAAHLSHIIMPQARRCVLAACRCRRHRARAPASRARGRRLSLLG
jgi:acyl-CoA thioesterase 11